MDGFYQGDPVAYSEVLVNEIAARKDAGLWRILKEKAPLSYLLAKAMVGAKCYRKIPGLEFVEFQRDRGVLCVVQQWGREIGRFEIDYLNL